MKKTGIAVISVLIVFLFIISLVVPASAYYYIDLRQGSQDVINWVTDFSEPFLQALFGGYGYSYLLFEKFLIFIILISIVYLSISRIPAFDEQKGVIWIISIVVPLIAVRFLDAVWLNTILIQYQVLGIALTSILPFIIYLFFLHNISDSSTVRKIGWIFFIVVYFCLWSTSDIEIYGQVYFWTMILSLAFLLVDGTIHRWWMKEQLTASGAADKWEQIAELRKDIRETRQAASTGDIPQRIGDKIIKKKQKIVDQWLRA